MRNIYETRTVRSGRYEREMNLEERESEIDTCIYIYCIRDFVGICRDWFEAGTYLLFGDLEGLQVVANYAQLLFKLDDLPAKTNEPFTTSPNREYEFLPESVCFL